jgi:hypothetical protein
MAACGSTPAPEHPGSPEEQPAVVTPASSPEPSTAGEDTRSGLYDVNIPGDKAASALEHPTITPMAQHSAAVPPPPATKQNRPTLLKPQYKTALKDFLVSISPEHYILHMSHIDPAYLLIFSMARQIATPRSSHGLHRGWRHHARHERHFRYGSLDASIPKLNISLTTR